MLTGKNSSFRTRSSLFSLAWCIYASLLSEIFVLNFSQKYQKGHSTLNGFIHNSVKFMFLLNSDNQQVECNYLKGVENFKKCGKL